MCGLSHGGQIQTYVPKNKVNTRRKIKCIFLLTFRRGQVSPGVMAGPPSRRLSSMRKSEFRNNKEEEMRKFLLGTLLTLAVGSLALPLVSGPAHAGCRNGDTYDAHGSRCR